MMWLYAWARAEPWPEKRSALSRSAVMIAAYVAGAFSSSQLSSVGPKLKLMRE
jgi:hypothetical protein